MVTDVVSLRQNAEDLLQRQEKLPVPPAGAERHTGWPRRRGGVVATGKVIFFKGGVKRRGVPEGSRSRPAGCRHCRDVLRCGPYRSVCRALNASGLLRIEDRLFWQDRRILVQTILDRLEKDATR